MASIFKIELVSFYVNYSEEDISNMLKDALQKKERLKGNTIEINVVKTT